MKIKPIKMSAASYESHCEEYNGICLSCGAVRMGETEGDAENYPCEECDEENVQGIQNLLVMGLIHIEE